jgi:6-phosphogluconolactonase
MRLWIAAANRAPIALFAGLLAGCSNTLPDSQSLPLGPSSATGSVARDRAGPGGAVQFAYVANYGSNNVSAYAVDATSGTLTPVAGSPFRAGTEPYGTAIDPTGKFAYVGDIGSNDVSAYAVDAASGALKKVAGSPFAAGTNPTRVAVDPTGKFAYVANVGSKNVSGYMIDATSGALTPVTGSPFSAGQGPFAVAVNPSGKFAYVANNGSNNVSAYAIDANSGALTPVKGSPFAAGIDPVNVTVDPSGKFAYVASYGSDNLYGYAIDAASGALRRLPGSPFADMGSGPFDVVIAHMGRFAYVPNSFSCCGFPDYVAAYTIDATRGTLTPMVGSPFKDVGNSAEGLAVDPASKFAYVTNAGSNNVSAYTIDGSSGALRKVKGSPFAAGTEPFGISVCRVTAGKCIPTAL